MLSKVVRSMCSNSNSLYTAGGVAQYTRVQQAVYRNMASSTQAPSVDIADSAPYDKKGSEFADRLHEMIQREQLLRGTKREGVKVIEFKHPQQIKDHFPFEIREGGADNAELLKVCEEIIGNSVKTSHPMYFNQLYYGGDPYGIAAAWLTEALNTNEHTFEVAPVFVMITEFVLRRLNQLIGFQDGDGIFCPGGSMSNIMGMALARYRHNNRVHKDGLYAAQRMVMFASEDCHYSYSKGSAFLGLGTDSVISVGTDARGRMDMTSLREKIREEEEKGHLPVAVLATSGTTVLGAFDDLEDIAAVCGEKNLWLHVDGCWGGGVMFSDKHRHLLNGVQHADSIGISLHKMMGAPLQCVPLLVKHKGLLQECFGQKATYLFQQDKFYDVSYDLGDKTVQCGRKVDAMKFWLMWKARGDAGMAKHVDDFFEKAAHFTRRIRETDGFELVMEEFQCVNIGFWYIPPRMRNQPRTPEWWQELHKIAPKLKESMQMNGSMLIGYQPMGGRNLVNFFRIIIINARTTLQDLDNVIQTIDDYGKHM